MDKSGIRATRAGTPSDRESATYEDAGVSIDAGNRLIDLIRPALSKTRRAGADANIGGFGGVFDLAKAGYSDPLLVAATDGVGTKVKLTIEAGIYDTIGIDLVAMCVNDLIVQGAEPLFFLDYFATGHLDAQRASEVVTGIAEGCGIAGAALIGGETAEMPGHYGEGDFDLAGFAVGAVERDRILPRKDLEAGDVVIGLSSSGAHANGFSLIRKLVADSGLGWRADAPFAEGVPLVEALLVPTRVYVPSILHAIRQSSAFKALAHITGGGLTENVPRAIPQELAAVIDLAAIPLPGVFSWLRELGSISEHEMLRVFNCGIGMVAIVAADAADEAVGLLRGAGETATMIGEIIHRRGDGIAYTGALT